MVLGEDPRQRGHFKRGDSGTSAVLFISVIYRCHI
jgi:hypothetical protein